MDTTPTPAAIYTRISQDATGQRAGVTRQLEDCTDLAQRLGLIVANHFDDNDLSAFSGKTRPGFEALLDGLKAGEFTTIICWHTDRLYRSMKDLERLIDIVDATGARIHTINSGDLDLSNATGKMLARILGSVSRQESEHKAERQRRASQQRRADGRWDASGRVPFGYAKVGEARNYTIVPAEPAASLVRQAAADVLAGVSMRSIAADWNARGITTGGGHRWRNVSLRKMLLNPVYAALVIHGQTTTPPYNGRAVGPGDWEPLFDKATHDGLVALLTDPARRTGASFERKHLGSGVYRCGVCGAKLYRCTQLRGGGKHGPGPRVYVSVYQCWEAHHLSRSAPHLDAYVESVVMEMLTATDIRARLADAPDVDVDELRTRRAALTARADELARLFATGTIDGSQLGSGTADLRAQIASIDRTLARLAASSPALTLLDGDPDELVNRWNATPEDLKGKVVDSLVTVTVNPALKGRNRFDPDDIDIAPKV
jgi:DNA invertase Pin-like site-specific DNA recombinase